MIVLCCQVVILESRQAVYYFFYHAYIMLPICSKKLELHVLLIFIA